MSETLPERVLAHEAAGRYVRVHGRRIFCRAEGEGPTVLLCHGVPASSYLYRKVLPRLAEAGLRGLAFDLPGLGLSDKPSNEAYDWHALAAWIERLVDCLDLEPVHLVVHDIGGPIGVEWAVRHPGRVRSITFLNTLLEVGSFSPPFPMWCYRTPVLRHLAAAVPRVGPFHFLMLRKGVKHADRYDRADTEAYLALLDHRDGWESFLAIMAGFDLTDEHEADLREGLHELDVPMQAVWGEHDRAIPVRQLVYLRETFDLGHVHLVDARHFLQEDRPGAVARHVASFCGEVDGRPDA